MQSFGKRCSFAEETRQGASFVDFSLRASLQDRQRIAMQEHYTNMNIDSWLLSITKNRDVQRARHDLLLPSPHLER